jgi:hypothetical protein
VHHDAVRDGDAAQRRAQGSAQQALRQPAGGVHAALRTARKHHGLDRVGSPDGHIDRVAAVPRRPQRVAFPRPLRGRDERELHRCRVDVARSG